MMHSEEFLRKMVNYTVMGNFAPFESGNHKQVEAYIKTIVGRLKDDHSLIVEPDFSHYGSGTASYASIRISKKDGSDSYTSTEAYGQRTLTDGLLLYVSYLVPYWYYGAEQWSVLRQNGKDIGGSGSFLEPGNTHSINLKLWESTIKRIKNVFNEYRYTLLTQEELEQKVPFNIQIPTLLADKPYRVFDCFFYWED